ncbi:hypothetical protein [Nocardioides cynanchi]|uniref:hypothetical protein n=1 Tax=Nocardioides cynanchi TaxID=2558918 RepID=UPI0012486C01|nr:hypothetical protein [Nocardioides cynanchi]
MTTVHAQRPHRQTPDSHDYPTRHYDLVKEFVIALAVMAGLSLALAGVFSSPDDKAITMASWAKADPADVVATATGELAGTTTSATYGAPYNHASEGQSVLGLKLQKWGGVGIPINSADLVLQPLRAVVGNASLTTALAQWDALSADQQVTEATAYADALAATPDGSPAQVARGNYGPVPALTTSFLGLAASGGLEGSLTSSGTFYGTDQTRAMLLLSDGAYLEDTAVADHLGGDQWGMMNEVGNYPGQPWMWLYTFWYQVKPFSTSENADTQVWALMMLLTLVLALVPWIPGVRSIPRLIPVHRLIWREHYRNRR